MTIPTTASSLTDFLTTASAKIRRKFEATGDGRAAALERATLIDDLVARLYREHFSLHLAGPEDFCFASLGGYGRQELYPHSDIDLLFLSLDARKQTQHREGVAAMSRTLWDLRLRVGGTARTLEECGKLHRDSLEFNVALLDCRYLAGDARLFARLRDEVVPHLVARDGPDLVRDLSEMTRRRHEKHGNTIFHLEPNIKEAPGGLRDYHVARWLALISELGKSARWKPPEDLWPAALRVQCGRAFEFLSAARVFLHHRKHGDDNHLTYELQDQAAALGIGVRPGERVQPEEWMRLYFRHARSIDRLCARLVEDTVPAQSSLYGIFQDWKSRFSNPDFSVVRGRIFTRRSAAMPGDLGLVLKLFELVARHGLELSREAEHWVEAAAAPWPAPAEGPPRFPGLWESFRRVLVAPQAAEALRAMHRLGVLDELFPEFRAIDSLVVRDFYHRYTVDEHSLMTIENLHRLRPEERSPMADSRPSQARRSQGGWEQRFSEILSELEQPELLYLCLLFHDVGKGLAADDHIRGSLEAVERVFDRLELGAEEREEIRFLISNHLAMSATLLRRDVFDPETVRTFAKKIGAPERLKMLCLLTYVDIQSVNPEAMTPWKAEMLWQLYASTSNYLTRSLDEERIRATGEAAALAERILQLFPEPAARAELAAFLEGFPTRYLRSHSAEEIAAHFRMARRLGENPVQLSVRDRKHLYDFTVLTHDRPFLFASLTGTLTAWGMNIVKADAFSNKTGTVLDTFRFQDLFRTLELNPSEVGRFEKSVCDVLGKRVSLTELMRGRVNPRTLPRTKVVIPTQIRLDDQSSTHSTLLELITQDRPGVLYEVSSVIAELGFNIEVALIDTEGQKVIDVFYLTSRGAKLAAGEQEALCAGLVEKLGGASLS